MDADLQEFFERTANIAKDILRQKGSHPTMLLILPNKLLVERKKVAELVPIHIIDTEDEDVANKMRGYVISVFQRCQPYGVAIVTEAVHDNNEAIIIMVYSRDSGSLKPVIGKVVSFDRQDDKISFKEERVIKNNDSLFTLAEGVLNKILAPIKS